MNRWRHYNPDPCIVARAALAVGPLMPSGKGNSRLGRRVFSHTTINSIIAAGEAERLDNGDVVARFLVPKTEGER